MTIQRELDVSTIVFIGGVLTLEDGSVVDSRQPLADRAFARAVERALVSSSDWWNVLVSIVIPTLNDNDHGYAFVNARRFARARDDGRISRARIPRYPRQDGGEDYIYCLGSKSPAIRTSGAARIRVDTDGSTLRNLIDDPNYYRGTRMLVVPDTAEMREQMGRLLHNERAPEEQVDDPNASPFRKLALPLRRSVCEVTGLVLGSRWEDASGLEAARRLLLERFDLRVGLWDLALNPVLRAAALDPIPTPAIPTTAAEAPAVARKRAEQESGSVAQALHRVLENAGWDMSFGLLHPIVRRAESPGAISHPFLRVIVSRNQVQVLAWNWYYTTYDINAFVDRRRFEFDEVSPLPMRKRLGESTAKILAKVRKVGAVEYEADRLVTDTRSVILWSTENGWSRVDMDWGPTASAILDRTPRWVALLADAVAESLKVPRATLEVIGERD